MISDFPELEEALQALRREWGTHAVMTVLGDVAKGEALQEHIDGRRGRAEIWRRISYGCAAMASLARDLNRS